MRTGKEKEIQTPTHCPVDGAKIVKEGVVYRCGNPKCGARHQQLLKHFVSRSAFNIQGLGPKILNRFLDEGLISDAADIFQLKEGDIAVLERFGGKSAQNIVSEVQLHKNVSLPRFIYSLGILHVGEEISRLLAGKFFPREKSLEGRRAFKIKDFIEQAKRISLEELQQVSGFGPRIAQSIYDWFHDQKTLNFWRNWKSRRGNRSAKK